MIIHQPTKSIVLKLRDPTRVLNALPGLSRYINANEGNVQIKHTFATTVALNAMGLHRVTSPIDYQYNWPGKYTPFAHQIPMADFHARNDKNLNLSEMGVGKSFATLWAADYLMTLGEVKKALILSPLNIIETIWQQDIFDVLMHRSCVVTHGDREFRTDALGLDVDFYIANHDMIAHKEVATIVRKRKDIDLIILDEASFFRNHRNISYKFLAWAVEKKKRIWFLTGTPCPNAPTDAWALARIICPHRVPQFFGTFQRKTMYQESQYKWRPVKGAEEIVFDALQPAWRIKKKDCMTLPPITVTNHQAQLTKEQEKHFKRMRDFMILQHNTTVITAVNAADALLKLRQICCIAQDTPVLTQRGWAPIQQVRKFDRLWDGVEWVDHDGVIDKGLQLTGIFNGVYMTPDHEVLCVQSCNRFNRVPVWLPDCDHATWYDHRTYEESNMVMPLYLRHASCTREPKSQVCKTTECETLWVPAWRVSDYPWGEQVSSLSDLDKHAPTMLRSRRQGLRQLWRTWYFYGRSMVSLFFSILERYASDLRSYAYIRSTRQRWSLQQGELSLGFESSTGEQFTGQSIHTNTKRTYDGISSSDYLQNRKTQPLLSTECGMVHGRSVRATKKVYDITNCGPRNRFVVRGLNGELQIVHNCGSVKNGDDSYETIDHSLRLKELLAVISQAAAKVIVVVPFKGIIRALEPEVAKHYSVAVLNGDVSLKERNRIIWSFKYGPDPHVLLCHPKVMAHGLNLTEADITVFYAPIYSHDDYAQVIERFNRAGQTHKMTVVRIAAHPFEWDIYNLLDKRATNQDNILKLYERIIQ